MINFIKQLKYTLVALSGLLRKHRLKIPNAPLVVKSKLKLTQKDVDRWMAFYTRHSPDVGRPHGDFPFFYFEPIGAVSFHKILNELGVNFRHILNLQTTFDFSPTFSSNIESADYEVETLLADLFEFDEKNRCVVDIQVKISKKDSVNPDLVIHSCFLVQKVPSSDLKVLRGLDNIKSKNRQFHFQSRPHAELGTQNDSYFKSQMLFSKNMGLEYGMISGDMNVVHTSWLMCKLFGIPKPFIQGLCIANYAVYKLGKRDSAGLRNFKIQYCRPIFLDQEIEIRYNKEKFEICDKDSKVLAKGEFTRHAAEMQGQKAS